MEEEERREDHTGGSHEAESTGSRGECAFKLGFRRSEFGRRWGWDGNLHPDTDKHGSTASSPLAVMETVTCCSRACVSEEPYQETMRHNNSFPWEAGGVEPIVCTLLRLWMLPLLQRAYINLAGSKQYSGAIVPSPRLQVTPHTSRCHKMLSCICPWLAQAQSRSTQSGGSAVLAQRLIYQQAHGRDPTFGPSFPPLSAALKLGLSCATSTGVEIACRCEGGRLCVAYCRVCARHPNTCTHTHTHGYAASCTPQGAVL